MTRIDKNKQGNYLGIDLGTSSVKVTLLDAKGASLGMARTEYPMLGTDEGRFEQDPEDWLQAIAEAMTRLTEITGVFATQNIAAIGLSGQMPTMVIMGKDGKARGNAIVWCDSRADEYAEQLLLKWEPLGYYKTTGIVLDGRYIVPMYLWTRANDPERLTGGHFMLSAKDYVSAWMTGEVVTDPSTASGYGIYALEKKAWDDVLCETIGIDMACLPEILPSTAPAGGLKSNAAKAMGIKEGIPVILGAADAMAGILGMGAGQEGVICQIHGSSTSIVAVTGQMTPDSGRRYFITPLALPDTYGMEADLLATGATSAWISNIFKEKVETLSAIAQKAKPGCNGLTFFPYLAGGEQGVLWDQALTGCIAGLSVNHGREHIIRAHFEGICYETKRCIGVFEDGGYIAREIMCSGSFARDPFFMQMTADILGKKCVGIKNENVSALGAAFLAGFGMKVWTMEEIVEIAGDGREIYEPDMLLHREYQNFYSGYIKKGEHLHGYAKNEKY